MNDRLFMTCMKTIPSLPTQKERLFIEKLFAHNPVDLVYVNVGPDAHAKAEQAPCCILAHLQI